MESTGQGSDGSPTNASAGPPIDPGSFIERRKTILNYVPGNICLSVLYNANTSLAKKLEEVKSAVGSNRAALQTEFDKMVDSAADAVRARVNQVLWSSLRRGNLLARPNAGSDLQLLVDFDLYPAYIATIARETSDQSKFLPLQPASGRKPIVLDFADGHIILLLCVATDPAIVGGNSDAPDPDLVREFVNAINRGLNPDERGVEDGGLIEHAAPNWLSSAAQNTCHGPGSQPRPATPQNAPRFNFPDPSTVKQIVDVANATENNRVVVAVLDTSPTRIDLSDGRSRLAAQTPSGPQPLWPDWLEGTINDRGFLTDPGWTPSDPSLLWIDELGLSVDNRTIRTFITWNGNPIFSGTFGTASSPPEFYLAPDHGLFVCGIVKAIAPKAEVHLVRVLDEYGVGDSMVLALTLQTLANKYPDRPLVVNLSLVLDQPIGPNFQALWFESAFLEGLWNKLLTEGGKGGKLERVQVQVDGVLASINFPIGQVVEWLAQKLERVLVVAAAGNDGNLRPPIDLAVRVPRSPSDRPEVLAVAALKNAKDPAPADYSNEGDPRHEIDNGIAVWGGNATVQGRDPLPKITNGAHGAGNQVDAIVGIFSSTKLPLGGGDNTTGWGYWAGTSFATPIISAIAACVWMNGMAGTMTSPPANGTEMMRHIRANLTDPTISNLSIGSLQAPAILVSQT